jgi:hypothetical protein
MPDEKFVWEVSYESPEVESTYSSFLTIDNVAEALVIVNPTVPLPDGEAIQMVRFKIVATSAAITLTSPWMFFFHVDPSVDVLTTENDITRALSATNSTSIFLVNLFIK